MRRSVLAMTMALPLAAFAQAAPAEDGPQTLMEHGRVRQAATLSESRLKSNPKDVESLRVLATIRAIEKKWDEAGDLAEKAVAAAPNDADAHYAAAQVAGMQAQAASVLKKPGLAGRFRKETEKEITYATSPTSTGCNRIIQGGLLLRRLMISSWRWWPHGRNALMHEWPQSCPC